MNVYITHTPEFSSDKFNEVLILLQGNPGELKFINGEQLTQAQYKRIHPRFDSFLGIKSLTFEEYFDLVQGYRDMRTEIMDEDFVIVVSTLRHDEDWFSAFSKRNIFVRGDEWDIISNVDSKFGIAYQCVENIFQSLSELDIINYNQEPNIHLVAIGCINDFCENRHDILYKLQSANICKSCFNRIDNNKYKWIIFQILDIIEVIRKEFVASKEIENVTFLEKIEIVKDGTILLGGKKVNLATMPKVLYIGFLQQLAGIPNDRICDNKHLFEKIYRTLKTNPDDYSIDKMCCKQVRYPRGVIEKNKPTFETYRTRVKDGLVKIVGVTLANLYSINLVEDANHNNVFKVSLQQDHIEIHPTFLE